MKIAVLLVTLFTILVNALPTPELLFENQSIGTFYSIAKGAEGYRCDTAILPTCIDDGITYPKPGTVWHVGQNVSVVFKNSLPTNQSVAIFFYQQTDVLAGGPLTTKKFRFVVPPTALSPKNGYSVLTAVRRVDNYLNAVDAVNITVLP